MADSTPAPTTISNGSSSSNQSVFKYNAYTKGITYQFPANLGQVASRPDGSSYAINKHVFCLDIFIQQRSRAGTTTIDPTVQSIYLPLPQQISNNFGANWNTLDGGYLTQAAYDIGADIGYQGVQDKLMSALSNIVSHPFDTTVNAVSDAMTFVKDNQSKLKSFGERLALQGASFIPQVQGFTAGAGIGIRDYSVQSFQGMNLREFSFSWHLLAKSSAEAEMLADIENAIKIAMHPTIIKDGFFVQFPKKFQPFFLFQPDSVSGGSNGTYQENGFLPKIKQCVLTNCSFVYNGGGMHSFHPTNAAPLSVDITLSMREDELIFADQFQNSGATTSTQSTTGTTIVHGNLVR